MNIQEYNSQVDKIIEEKIWGWIEEHKKENDCKLSELDPGNVLSLRSDIATQFYALNELEVIFYSFLKKCSNENINVSGITRIGNDIKIEINDGVGLNDKIG